MTELYVQILLVTFSIAILVWIASSGRKVAHKAPLPPGPPADPIVGHIRIVPTESPEFSYGKWAKQYHSDVIHVNMMGQPIVVLHSAEAAIDLLDKRSNIYSDRPSFHFFEEQGFTDALTFMSLGPKFRKHRRMIQNAFSITNCIQYCPRQEALARTLANGLIEQPTNWERVLVRFATSITLGIVYGVEITGDGDPYIDLADKIAWLFANGGSPGATLVDIFPILRCLPHWVCFIPSLKFARDAYPTVRSFIEIPFQAVKEKIGKGNSPVCFVKNMFETEIQSNTEKTFNSAEVTEDDIKGAAMTIYTAGTDTTYATIVIFILNMVRNVEIQEKARQEIDRVIGRNRLPSLDDRPNMPYINRIFYETARWHPVVPLGVPHKLQKDDYYKNMLIPKGSLVMANAHFMTHDPSIYSDPDSFNPDRYLPISEGGNGEPKPVGHFGFGRRICPGQHLGSASVWIAITTILATFKISKAVDSDGMEITPNPNMTTGLESHPEHFPCVLRPRDERAIKLVQEGSTERMI